MGIVDYAASTCLAISGLALAAPFIEAKVPAVASVSGYFVTYKKIIGIFGIIGGALGVIVLPLILLFLVGPMDLLANPLLMIIAGLEFVGCVATIALGAMVLRKPAPTEPHSGEIDLPTMLGLGGVAYGGLLFVLFTAVGFIS